MRMRLPARRQVCPGLEPGLLHRLHPPTSPGHATGRFHFRRSTIADYFTHFSCLLDVGTSENALAAHRLFTKQRLKDGERDEPLCSGFELTLQEGDADHILWIHDDVSGDVEQIIGFVLRLAHEFDLKGLWGFDYANTCSRARVDAFGGGAHAIDLGARKSIGWISTQEWLAAALNGEAPDA